MSISKAWPSIATAFMVVLGANADVVLDAGRFKLVIGEDARARSLVIKSTGEECLDTREGIPLFSTTQERPFNNEIKLAWPNKRTTYPANRLRQDEKGRLVVGFEIAPYEAVVSVKKGDGYLAFTLEDFNCVPELQYSWLKMDVPPVAEFRLVQLPVKKRAKFGDWLNVSWDDRAAVAVVGVDPYVTADHADRHGFRLLNADVHRSLRLKGGCSAIVCGAGEKDFLDSMDALEKDFGLPRGVQSRRSGQLNRSICWIFDVTPETVDGYIAMAKKGGFTMMLIYYPSIVKTNGYRLLGDYDWRSEYPNGADDLKSMLAKIKAAGITPGFHTLQTHIGVKSRYVTPVLDHRLNKTRRFTLARAKNWLTSAQKEALKSSTQEHHLYLNGNGEYELHEIEMLPTPAKAPKLRGFMFERGGQRVVAYWHTSGQSKVRVVAEDGVAEETVDIGPLRYRETELSRESVRRIVAAAVDVGE